MGNLHDVSVDNANIHDVHLGCKILGKLEENIRKSKAFLQMLDIVAL